jgi:hypothetical protein
MHEIQPINAPDPRGALFPSFSTNSKVFAFTKVLIVLSFSTELEGKVEYGDTAAK